MLRAIIIDDEYNGVRALELLIQKFITDVKVVATSTNPLEGIDLINNYRPEIVFLDINMPVLTGFQLLDSLEYKDFHLIFSTAFQEHGLKALKRNAIDYLLKPVSIADLKMAVQRVMKKVAENERPIELAKIFESVNTIKQQKIAFPTKSTIEYIPASEIQYIEASSNNCIAVISGNVHLQVLKSLKDYEAQLCIKNSRFIRVHNSYIVNLDYASRYIREDGGTIVMVNKKSIPVSKTKKNDLLMYLNTLQIE